MLHYIFGQDLHHHPQLCDAMFRDRADQFHTRLKWKVSVNAAGQERDAYDDLNPLYVIWQGANGAHGGSMRLMPTDGRVMVNEHFSHLLAHREIRDAGIWECTRFCLSRGAAPNVASALMLGGGEVMRGLNIRQYVGVFDARMVRIYRMIGASPEIQGSAGTGRDRISAGLWSFSNAARARLAVRAGISPDLSEWWFRRSLGDRGILAA